MTFIVFQTGEAKQNKLCPSCNHRFNRAKREFVAAFQDTFNICPNCGEYLYYSKRRGKQTIILAEDKFTCDCVLKIFGDFISERDGHDLGEASSGERHFIYQLIDFSKEYINRFVADIAMTRHQFLVEFTKWLLSDECDRGFWADNLRSMNMISNQRKRLVADFYEKRCAVLGVDTVRVANIRARLKQKVEELWPST